MAELSVAGMVPAEDGSDGEIIKAFGLAVPVAGIMATNFLASQGTFFDVYTQLMKLRILIFRPAHSLEDRQRQLLTAAANAIGVDVIVTYASTAMRHDVADTTQS